MNEEMREEKEEVKRVRHAERKKYTQTHRYIYGGQTDRQTNKTNKQTDKQTNKQTDRQTERETKRHIDYARDNDSHAPRQCEKIKIFLFEKSFE
jgi:hypothetical protein